MPRRGAPVAMLSVVLLISLVLPGVSMAAAVHPGIAAALSVSAIPHILPADGRSFSSIVVSLLDDSGDASVATANMTVFLTSSNSSVGSVPSVGRLVVGHPYLVVNFTTTLAPGNSVITVTSVGLARASTTIGTAPEGGSPASLSLYAAPSKGVYIPDSDQFLVAVQLLDPSGGLATATQKMLVILTSSNKTVIGTATGVTIQPGQDVAYVTATVAAPGPAVLTAVSQGVASSSAPVQVVSAPLSFSMAASSTVIRSNQTTDMKVTVVYLGAGLANATVTWSSTGGVMIPQSPVTDNTGSAIATFSPTATGGATVTAIVTDRLFGSINVSAPVVVIAPPSSTPTSTSQTLIGFLTQYIAVIVILVVLVVALLMVRRLVRRSRRLKELEEEGFEEGEEGAEGSP